MATPDARDLLQAGLGAQYTLERELGRGGMATVYLARDPKHQRFVALKVLHPDLAAALGAERFRREITTAAQLQHPHILSVYDSGETPNGLLWFTMPYVEGESVRERLGREGRLSIDDATRIARDVAGALGYAHERGVIHRDIKPENVLLTTQGDALLADFGIARALHGSTDGTLTEAGFMVGTPRYMSPEQAAGDPTLGARSDIYSLGVVLYEMLAGRPPFTGASPQAILAQILTDDVPPVRTHRSGVGPALDEAVGRALARQQEDRFASATDMAQALTAAERSGATPVGGGAGSGAGWMRLGLATVALIAGVVGIALWRRNAARPPVPGMAEASAAGLAVLPFDTQGDTADAYFADGITDEIRGKLSGIPALRLIASASSNHYRGSTESQSQIARELGVRYLLTGRVQWEHLPTGVRRVRVRPELVEIREGIPPEIRWQSTYDTTLADVFEVQAAVASRVAEKLGVVLSPPSRAQLESRPTQNFAAYDAYLRSTYVGVDPATLRRALRAAQEAVALDSTYAKAWAQISLIHTKLVVLTHPTKAEADSARDAAERAVALAPSQPWGYIARGYYAVRISNDRAAARAAYGTALRLEPSSPEATQALTGAEASAGDWSAALDHARLAVALDPRSAVAVRDLGWVLNWMRHYPEARQTIEHGLILAPVDLDMTEARTVSLLGQGDLKGARAGLRDVPSTLDRPSLVAYVSNYWDLYWVLDSADQALVLSLTPHAYDDDRGTWALIRSQLYGVRGDTVLARAYADSAMAVFDAHPSTPDDFQRPLARGLALARLGQREQAEREGEHGMALAVARGDNFGEMAYARHMLARLYVTTGNHAKALDQLDSLLAKPYFISGAWLTIDPAWAPLVHELRFARMVGDSGRGAVRSKDD